MPFFKPAKIDIKDCGFLQVLKSVIYNKRITNRKRAYLFTSKGSISIEAAIAVSSFLLIVLFMESYLMFVNTEFGMQIKINNVVREVSKNMFYASMIDEISDENKKLKEIKESQEQIITGVKEGYLKARLFQEIGWDSSNYFLCGVAGLNTTESSIENGIVDLVATYKMEMPLVNRYMTFTQRGKAKGWDGVDICIPQDIVYITENGEVYHTTKNCSHLSINISKEIFSKNNIGKNYSKCKVCIEGTPNDGDNVFVTEDGNRYHVSLKCSGLTRKIITTSIEGVSDMPICSRCGKENNDS